MAAEICKNTTSTTRASRPACRVMMQISRVTCPSMDTLLAISEKDVRLQALARMLLISRWHFTEVLWQLDSQCGRVCSGVSSVSKIFRGMLRKCAGIGNYVWAYHFNNQPDIARNHFGTCRKKQAHDEHFSLCFSSVLVSADLQQKAGIEASFEWWDGACKISRQCNTRVSWDESLWPGDCARPRVFVWTDDRPVQFVGKGTSLHFNNRIGLTVLFFQLHLDWLYF